MARSTIYTDDIDGSSPAEPFQFAVNGTTYEVDLAEKNRKKLTDFLATYIGAGRKVGAPAGAASRSRGSRSSTPRDYDIAALRAWAASNKVEVPARGRIPQAVVDQFHAAGN